MLSSKLLVNQKTLSGKTKTLPPFGCVFSGSTSSCPEKVSCRAFNAWSKLPLSKQEALKNKAKDLIK